MILNLNVQALSSYKPRFMPKKYENFFILSSHNFHFKKKSLYLILSLMSKYSTRNLRSKNFTMLVWNEVITKLFCANLPLSKKKIDQASSTIHLPKKTIITNLCCLVLSWVGKTRLLSISIYIVKSLGFIDFLSYDFKTGKITQRRLARDLSWEKVPWFLLSGTFQFFMLIFFVQSLIQFWIFFICVYLEPSFWIFSSHLQPKPG